ncbi:hypothetical protein EJB05_08835, partial [Eragrostis curvula]
MQCKPQAQFGENLVSPPILSPPAPPPSPRRLDSTSAAPRSPRRRHQVSAPLLAAASTDPLPFFAAAAGSLISPAQTPAVAASQMSTVRTASICAAEAARGTHSFKIANYSLHKGLGVGKFISSATFSVGGHQWRILFYPDGGEEDDKDYVSVFLDLVSQGVTVRVIYDFRLVEPATGLSSSVSSCSKVFCAVHPSFGVSKFKKRSDLEGTYVQNDCLVIECEVTAIKESRAAGMDMAVEVQVPPSNLSDNFVKFLETEEEVDVTFKVKGEVFRAHRLVLAMRSPVFKAELCGPMKHKRREIITIEEMEPAAFKALLHFIYTDSLLDLDGDDMVKHLLVAADRYGMERMKLMCESILCRNIDVENVASTLALADQHHCNKLKDVCIEFINSCDRIGDVVASKGYEHLKRACPTVFMDVWERSVKSRRVWGRQARKVEERWQARAVWDGGWAIDRAEVSFRRWISVVGYLVVGTKG